MVTKVCSVVLALLLAAGSFAQGEAPDAAPAPVRPAITILRETSRPVAAAVLAKSLGRVLGEEVARGRAASGPWVADEDGGVVGACAGRTFAVTFHDGPVELTKAATRHLDDDGLARLARHRVHVVIERTGTFDPAESVADHDALGAVARSLLGRGCVGIGAREHGTFEPAGPDTVIELAEGKALHVLRPTMHASLVALLSKRRELVEAEVTKALQAEFEADGGAEVMLRSGQAMVFLKGQLVIVSVRDGVANPEFEADDLRVQKAMRSHEALLHVATFGDATDAAEAARRRALGRVMAALWGDDCMALSWHCELRVLPACADVPLQLRSRDPVRATVENTVVPVWTPDDERAMEAAIAEARKSWAKGKAYLDGGGALSAKFPFPTRGGSEEHIWIAVTKVDGATVHGKVANEPLDIEGLELGSEVARPLAELSDWLYFVDGEMVGGYTVKVLMEQARRREEEAKRASKEGGESEKAGEAEGKR